MLRLLAAPGSWCWIPFLLHCCLPNDIPLPSTFSCPLLPPIHTHAQQLLPIRKHAHTYTRNLNLGTCCTIVMAVHAVLHGFYTFYHSSHHTRTCLCTIHDDTALSCSAEILEAPGSSHLIITHKSMARAFLCTALALPPTSFRSLDMNNGGVSIFRCVLHVLHTISSVTAHHVKHFNQGPQAAA